MRPPTPLVLIALLMAPVTIAAPPPGPVCGTAAMDTLQDLTNVIVCPVTVPDGEEEEYNNDSYEFLAPITVEDGGRVEIILSEVTIGPDGLIHVESGGTIVIDASDLTAAPSSIIQLDAGANVEIMDSDFSGVTLHVATDGATIDTNTFTLGSPAVRLDAFNGLFSDNTFLRNSVALNVTGGTPEISDLTFRGDVLGIEIHNSHVSVHDLVMIDVTDGIRMTWSQGTLGSQMAIDDRSLPPDTGIEVLDTSGNVEIFGNSISEWGTGIFYCRADVNIHDNFFSNNGEDVASCEETA